MSTDMFSKLESELVEMRKDINQLRIDINALNKGCMDRMSNVNKMVTNLITVMTHECDRNAFIADAMKRAQQLIMKAEDNEADMRKEYSSIKKQNAELLDRLMSSLGDKRMQISVKNQQN